MYLCNWFGNTIIVVMIAHYCGSLVQLSQTSELCMYVLVLIDFSSSVSLLPKLQYKCLVDI